jgi:hypothetical protein
VTTRAAVEHRTLAYCPSRPHIRPATIRAGTGHTAATSALSLGSPPSRCRDAVPSGYTRGTPGTLWYSRVSQGVLPAICGTLGVLPALCGLKGYSRCTLGVLPALCGTESLSVRLGASPSAAAGPDPLAVAGAHAAAAAGARRLEVTQRRRGSSSSSSSRPSRAIAGRCDVRGVRGRGAESCCFVLAYPGLVIGTYFAIPCILTRILYAYGLPLPVPVTLFCTMASVPCPSGSCCSAPFTFGTRALSVRIRPLIPCTAAVRVLPSTPSAAVRAQRFRPPSRCPP